MASPLKLVRDQIATTIEALTPPSSPARTYHQITGRSSLDGAAADRTFEFGYPSSSTLIEYAASLSVWSYVFTLSLRLSTTGRARDAMLDAVDDERILIANAINNVSAWVAGCRECRTEAISVDDGPGVDGDDLLINYMLTAEIEETA